MAGELVILPVQPQVVHRVIGELHENPGADNRLIEIETYFAEDLPFIVSGTVRPGAEEYCREQQNTRGFPIQITVVTPSCPVCESQMAIGNIMTEISTIIVDPTATSLNTASSIEFTLIHT